MIRFQEKKIPPNVLINKLQFPDLIVADLTKSKVLEVSAFELTQSASHTSGISLRFPKVIRIRNNKNYNDCNSLNQLQQMYDQGNGARKQNMNEKPKDKKQDTLSGNKTKFDGLADTNDMIPPKKRQKM